MADLKLRASSTTARLRPARRRGLSARRPARAVRARRAPRAWGLALLLIAGAALVCAMWAIVPSGPTGGDRAAFGVLAATPGSPVVGAMKVLSHVAPPLLAAIVVLASAVVALRRQWPTAAALLGGTIITYGAVHLAKSIEQRPRPHGELMHAGGFAFPSTAAALSIALVAVAIVLERTPLAGGGRGRLLGPASVAVAALGALLMSVRVHYLTDVLAGWGLGVAVFAGAGLAAIAVSALPPRRRSRRPALPASRS